MELGMGATMLISLHRVLTHWLAAGRHSLSLAAQFRTRSFGTTSQVMAPPAVGLAIPSLYPHGRQTLTFRRPRIPAVLKVAECPMFPATPTRQLGMKSW